MATKAVHIMSKEDIAEQLKRHEKFLMANAEMGVRSANFIDEYLLDEDFSAKDLSYARFQDATLQNVNFSNANLTGAHFDGAILDHVTFSGANLTGAYFTKAQFSFVNLLYANMQDTNMRLVDVDHIMINKDTNLFIPFRCPSSGSFVGWKKAYNSFNAGDPYKICIVKLLIPEDAKRSSAFSEKCRCDKAVILDTYDYETGHPLEKSATIRSIYLPFRFTYHIGDTITIPDFDDNRWKECSSGFHFFVDEESAKNYWQ